MSPIARSAWALQLLADEMFCWAVGGPSAFPVKEALDCESHSHV
jgi:hypothetical protein